MSKGLRRRKLDSQARAGSALVLALWGVLAMSVGLMAVIEITRIDMEDNAARNRDFRARQLAESGLAIGINPMVSPSDHILQQEVLPGEGWKVQIATEEGRMSINLLLSTPEGLRILNDLLDGWGMKDQEIRVIIESLQDWIDGDDLKHLNGAEKSYYEDRDMEGFPLNRPFHDLDEMMYVRGWDAVMDAQPSWRDSFTVWGDGKIDVNEASAETLARVCHVPDSQVEQFVQMRLGKDGEKYTEDDVQFKSLDEVRTLLSIPQSDWDKIAPLLTTEGTLRRITSKGVVPGHERTIEVVARKGDSPVRYLEWIEK